MTAAEKVAYIKGLTEGLGVDKESKEGKIITAILDVLEDLALGIADLEENALCIGDELDMLSQDLAEVEDIVYDLDEDDEDDEDDDEEDEDDEDDEYPFDEDDYMFSVVCPNCQEEITLDESLLDVGSIECPNCGSKLEFEFDEDDEDEPEEER